MYATVHTWVPRPCFHNFIWSVAFSLLPAIFLLWNAEVEKYKSKADYLSASSVYSALLHLSTSKGPPPLPTPDSHWLLGYGLDLLLDVEKMLVHTMPSPQGKQPHCYITVTNTLQNFTEHFYYYLNNYFDTFFVHILSGIQGVNTSMQFKMFLYLNLTKHENTVNENIAS